MVSIVIPTYKRPDLLRRAVKSVLVQTYVDFEVIIVNDDLDSFHLVKNEIDSLQDHRLVCYQNERSKGGNGARNTGILKSKGEYIAFLDDDDEWLENKLEDQLYLIEQLDKNYAGVYSGYLIEEDGNWEEYFGDLEGNIFNEVLLNRAKICTGSNLLIKKHVIEEVGLWDEELFRQQDLEFLLRVLVNYKLGFKRSLGAKIYGHNTPNPEKAFLEREKFLKKISNLLDDLNEADQNNFYSDHYRRQALFQIKMGAIQNGLSSWYLGTKYKLFSGRKDAKLIITMITGLLKINK
jgi:glycosyltransferase involved in cell wall biosynthesis